MSALCLEAVKILKYPLTSFKEHLFIIINFSAAEYETRKREKSGGGVGGDKTEQSWEWGKLPKSADHSDKDDTDGKDKVRS